MDLRTIVGIAVTTGRHPVTVSIIVTTAATTGTAATVITFTTWVLRFLAFSVTPDFALELTYPSLQFVDSLPD